MKHRIIKSLAILVAALGMVLGLNAGMASASSDGPTVCNAGACAWFKHDGDKVLVQDVDSDGHSAYVQVCAPSSCSIVADKIWNANGAGSTVTYAYGTVIPEGTNVYYRACTGESSDHSTVGTCSGWTHGQA